MDAWGWSALQPWLAERATLPVGPLFCVIVGPTRGHRWSESAARLELHRTTIQAGVRRRFAPHQVRHAHAVELLHEGIPLPLIQRQLGHSHLSTTGTYLQGISSEEIISTVHARRAPMMHRQRRPRAMTTWRERTMRSRHRLQVGHPHAAILQHKSNGERSALVLVPSEHVVGSVPGYRNPWRSGTLEVVGELSALSAPIAQERHAGPRCRISRAMRQRTVGASVIHRAADHDTFVLTGPPASGLLRVASPSAVGLGGLRVTWFDSP